MLNCLKTIIETDRLLLVPISLDFVKDIFREFTAEITVFMTPKPPEKIEETREFIKSALEKMKKNEELQMVVLKPVDRDNIPSRKIPESLGGREIFMK